MFDDAGNVVVVARLDVLKLAQRTGRLPQNVQYRLRSGPIGCGPLVCRYCRQGLGVHSLGRMPAIATSIRFGALCDAASLILTPFAALFIIDPCFSEVLSARPAFPRLWTFEQGALPQDRPLPALVW